jgi:hypothetical protein
MAITLAVNNGTTDRRPAKKEIPMTSYTPEMQSATGIITAAIKIFLEANGIYDPQTSISQRQEAGVNLVDANLGSRAITVRIHPSDWLKIVIAEVETCFGIEGHPGRFFRPGIAAGNNHDGYGALSDFKEFLGVIYNLPAPRHASEPALLAARS